MNIEKTMASPLMRGIFQIADPKIWIASFIPMLCGIALGTARTGSVDLYWVLLSIVCVFLVEIGKNAANECLDYVTGVDTGIDAEHRTPFSGGKKTIVDGLLTLNQCFMIALVSFAFAIVIGLAVVVFYNPLVLWLGLAGLAFAVLYSLPPFKLCYRGLGELTVGLAFGPIVLNGMYVLIARRFDLLPLLVSLPIGFLIANVLWINQYPDYEADKAGGKKNLVVRLGKKKAAYVYGLLFALSYIGFAATAAAAQNALWLIPMLTVPLAIKAVRNCFVNYDNIPLLILSNAATVQIYQITGVLVLLCVVIDKLVF